MRIGRVGMGLEAHMLRHFYIVSRFFKTEMHPEIVNRYAGCLHDVGQCFRKPVLRDYPPCTTLQCNADIHGFVHGVSCTEPLLIQITMNAITSRQWAELA